MKSGKNFAILLVLQLLLWSFSGCKINQTRNKLKEGKWIYKDTVNDIPYRSSGKYYKGIERRTWLYYTNDKLTKKEKYRKGICYTTTYFEDGAIASKGKTKLVVSETDTHWYYFGTWNFYDASGKLIRVKEYENGELVKDRQLN